MFIVHRAHRKSYEIRLVGIVVFVWLSQNGQMDMYMLACKCWMVQMPRKKVWRQINIKRNGNVWSSSRSDGFVWRSSFLQWDDQIFYYLWGKHTGQQAFKLIWDYSTRTHPASSLRSFIHLSIFFYLKCMPRFWSHLMHHLNADDHCVQLLMHTCYHSPAVM